MVEEINLVRTNPGEYISFVEAYINDNLEGKTAEIASAKALIKVLKNTKPMEPLQPVECLFIAARDHGINQAPTGRIKHKDTNGKASWDRVEAACSESLNKSEHGLGGSQNIAGFSMGSSGGYAKNDIRKVNIMLLIDHGNETMSNRENILSPDWTHVSAFTYHTKKKEFMKEYGMDIYSVDFKWIQSFARSE